MSKQCNDPNHPCSMLRNRGNYGSHVALIQNNESVLLGYENEGVHANTYNFFGGRPIPEDEGCYLRNAHREFTQELGCELSFDEFEIPASLCKASNIQSGVSQGIISHVRFQTEF